MPSHTDIHLDITNMMTESIGPSGVRREDIDSLSAVVRPIVDGLNDLRKLGQLPFSDLPYHEETALKVVAQAKVMRERSDSVLLLGIGGSALGASFLVSSLGETSRLIVCDDLDAARWKRIAEGADFRKTAVIVVSKSGKTMETMAAFLFFRKVLEERVGGDWKRQVVIITDPREGPLRKIAQENDIGSFEIPPGVGGRYSVLTPAGLFPAACAGVDILQVLAGARRMDERCRKGDPWFNPALMSAVLHFLFDTRKGRKVRVVMPYGGSLRGFSPWFAQLWAESLGKKMVLTGKEIFAGTTPVPAFGPEDQHSQLQLYLEGPQDKTVTFVASERETGDWPLPEEFYRLTGMPVVEGASVGDLLRAERLATEKALAEADRPSQTILLKEVSPYAIGQLLYLAKMETVYAGELYNVNPFDQPAVEGIKRKTADYLAGRISEKKNRSYLI